MRLIRNLPAYSIRDGGCGLDSSPDLWLQSHPAWHRRLRTWQTGGDHLCVETPRDQKFRGTRPLPHNMHGYRQGLRWATIHCLFAVLEYACEKLLWCFVYRIRDRTEHTKGGKPLTGFQARDYGSIDTRPVGQLLLTDVLPAPRLPYYAWKALEQAFVHCVPHCRTVRQVWTSGNGLLAPAFWHRLFGTIQSQSRRRGLRWPQFRDSEMGAGSSCGRTYATSESRIQFR